MKPIFIGGTGRSGTTILKQMLACHSMIIALPRGELRVIVDPGGALDLILALSDRWSPYNADIAIHRFRDLMLDCARTNLLKRAANKLFRALGISPPRYLAAGFARHFGTPYYYRRLAQLVEELRHHESRGSWAGSPPLKCLSTIYETSPLARQEAERILAQFFDDLYSNFAAGEGQTHWIDDTPPNLLHAHELLRLFPDARLVHIYRDPRDVMASYQRHSWGGDDFVATAQRLAGMYERWFEIRESLPSGSYTEVGLEALADDLTAGLTAICEFVGLDFEEGLTRTPFSIDRLHAGRWRRDLPEGEWVRAQPFLRPSIEAYGYEDE